MDGAGRRRDPEAVEAARKLLHLVAAVDAVLRQVAFRRDRVVDRQLQLDIGLRLVRHPVEPEAKGTEIDHRAALALMHDRKAEHVAIEGERSRVVAGRQF